MAILIAIDGTETEVHPKNGRAFTIEELYALLECEVAEHVGLRRGESLWIDEWGKLKRLPPNESATALARFARSISPFDVIVGPALLTHRGEVR